MNVYADLKLHGDRATLLRAVGDIEGALVNGWSRSEELEKRLRSKSPVRCFVCDAAPNRRAANLWFSERDDGRSWSVDNIIPTDSSRLSEPEYNAILQDFKVTFLDPVANLLNLRVEMSKTNEDLEDWMTREAADALRDFSDAANKSTGSSHPLDKERWFRFLTEIHKSGRAPDGSTLLDWLVQEAEWPSDTASDLAAEYENGLALLRYYDAI